MQETEIEFEEEVDLLMSSDIIVAELQTKHVQFNRSQSGWIFREDRREMIGPFQADVYSVQGVALETRKRREHLSPEDLAKNKEALVESLAKAGNTYENGVSFHRISKESTDFRDYGMEFDLESYRNMLQDEYQRRESLDPPEKRDVTWTQYIEAEPGQPPCLGREKVSKASSKGFKATLAMVIIFYRKK